MVRDAPYETVMVTGLACVDVWKPSALRRMAHATRIRAERQALRAGHVASSLLLGGRRVAVLD
jgi:hypothetical protein